MWRELVYDIEPNARFGAPASAEEIDRLEREFAIVLPSEFRELLLETNGVRTGYGTHLIFTVQDIIDTNKEFRTHPDFRELYMPFDPLLFFGMDTNGDQYAYVILNGEMNRDDVFVWDHETDSRTWFAGSLRSFLQTSRKEA